METSPKETVNVLATQELEMGSVRQSSFEETGHVDNNSENSNYSGDSNTPLINASSSVRVDSGTGWTFTRTLWSKFVFIHRAMAQSQFLLLLWKNLMLMWRSKLWTLFEFILPIVFTLPIVLAITKLSNISMNPALSFDPVRINGNSQDVRLVTGFVKTIGKTWCMKDGLTFAYSTSGNQTDADFLMNELKLRYEDADLGIQRFSSFDDLLEALKLDLPAETVVGCNLNKYVGGVYFKEIDFSTRNIDYQILLYAGGGEGGDASRNIKWHLDETWEDPYGPTTDYSKLLPNEPPYWSSGFLSFQFAIDAIFLANTSGSKVDTDYNVFLQRLPEPEYHINSVSAFIKFLPILWGICSFLSIIHAARDVAHEKQTVKAFLSVKGLNTFSFYLSHIFFSFIKCWIIFFVCTFPLLTVLANVNICVFILVMGLYALGSVTFGVMIASIFNSSNSALKATIVFWVAMVGTVYIASTRLEDVFGCFIWSLNINVAFYYAVTIMSHFMYKEANIGWFNLFEGGTLQFTVGYAMLMMIIDIFIMIVLTMIFDQVFGNSEFSLRGMFQGTEDLNEMDKGSTTGSVESDPDVNSESAEIYVKDIVKIWPQTGERAVDHFSFQAHKGRVTVLLGHNGAGKSTTFSILCGLVTKNKGTVRLCGKDVEYHKTQNLIGLCPQGNSIFDKLTVVEHLRLVHGLKKATTDFSDDAKDLLDCLKLKEKENELAQNLSGGQKRKLCVAMALIGKSPIVMLDEPTAGMDTGARRDVEILLEREKKSRTILLTTHYMDEAETLGDRIAIMAKGRMICFGTVSYLQKKYGTGYILSAVAKEGTDIHWFADELVALARSKGVEIRTNLVTEEKIEKGNVSRTPSLKDDVTILGNQIQIKLPHAEDNVDRFPAFFAAMEKEQDRLNMVSYGLNLNTLQQIFLRVGEMAEDEKKGKDAVVEVENDAMNLISSQRDPKYTGFWLLWNQIRAIVRKRVLYSIRNWPQLITQVIVPLAILIFVVWLSKYKLKGNTDKERTLGYTDFGANRLIYQRNSQSLQGIADSYLNSAKVMPDWQVVQLSAAENFTHASINLPRTLPATGLGVIFQDSTIKAAFNSRAHHSIPATLNLLSNAALRSKGEGSGLIKVSIFTYASKISDSRNLVNSDVINNILGPLLVLALALVTSTFVMFLVEERTSKFAHQQSLSGISPFVFWFVSFAYDAVFYSIICALFLAFFIISRWMAGYLGFVILLWGLYFWGCVPFVYAVSFMFSSPSKANVLLVIWQIVAAFAAMLIIFIATMIKGMREVIMEQSDESYEFLRDLLLFFLPSFSLGNGLMTLAQYSGSKVDPSKVWEWDNLGKNIVFMFFFGLISLAIFIAFQFKRMRYWWFKLWDLRYMYARRSQVGSGDVESYEALPNSAVTDGSSIASSNSNYALEVKDLTKMYGGHLAVDRINIGVTNGECFGLLGVNGAGKTTTFDILTGQLFPTSGQARIDGRDVTEQIAIGYCPQFDAMLPDLTGRETLEILARLYGFVAPEDKAVKVLRAVGMLEHADKLVRYYSGGQKRKMSVGLALIAETRIVILDEPTAGIDPLARREIWEVLRVIRDKTSSAILLTSHIMEECETLCNRIGVLCEGKLAEVGTAQELKSKHGNSYILTMVVKQEEDEEVPSKSRFLDRSPPEVSRDETDSAVGFGVKKKRHFSGQEPVKKQLSNEEMKGKKIKTIAAVENAFHGAKEKTHGQSSMTLVFQIEKHSGQKWSEVFAKCHQLAKDLKCDFSLTQSSLEEAFLQLVKYEEE